MYWPQTLPELVAEIPASTLDVTKPPYWITRYASIDDAKRAAMAAGVPLFDDRGLVVDVDQEPVIE